MPIISALTKLRQEDYYEFEASLAYKVSLRPVWATELGPVSKATTTKSKIVIIK